MGHDDIDTLQHPQLNETYHPVGWITTGYTVC
jgi:hypothetical protein